MAHRYFSNDSDNYVREAVEGLTIAHPELALEPDPLYVYLKRRRSDKVALLSGGGTGHEPLHAGFIGAGMLDAAVPGAVFASPTAIQVAAATSKIAGERGVLHIVKNYTGDVINFKIAAELCADEGIEVRHVLVADDVATDIEESRVGRRGTGATLLVEKICGAAAESGANLDDLVSLGERVGEQSRSMALALNACTHPGTGKKSFDLAADEVEFGVGIHGERGRARIPFSNADDLVAQLLEPVCNSLELQRGEGVVAFINGLGSTHPTEQYLVTRAVRNILQGRGIEMQRVLTGSYVTALDMSGISITLLRASDEFLKLWDAPVTTPALRW